MTTRTRALAAGFAVGGLLIVTACNNSESLPVTSPTTSSSTTPSPTSAPTRTLSPAEKDLKSAKDAVTRFWSLTDELASNPTRNLGELATVASDQAIAQWRFILTGDRVKQLKQIGKATIVSSEAKATSGNSFDVTACIDVSKVNVVDKNGKSVVAAGRLPRVQYTYKVAKIPSGFFVTKDTLEGKPC
jgi:hypothetical protein